MTKTQSLGVKIDSLLTIHPWTATYRVQLNAAFRFDDLAAVAPYMAELGISHVLTGAETYGGDVPAGELLRDFPVALLVRGEAA
jgi:maltooligosyltrehalose synthase